jgi:two-component system phosphate regulon response regulator OmpR
MSAYVSAVMRGACAQPYENELFVRFFHDEARRYPMIQTIHAANCVNGWQKTPMQKRILIVDDDPIVREIVVDALTDVGFTVLPFADGRDVINAVATEGIDLAIVDLLLPDVDGLTLVRHIRENSDAGVLILSGQDGMADRIVGLELGADDYVTKPFHASELTARVRSVLRRVESNRVIKEQGTTSAEFEFEFEGWRLNLWSHSLRQPDGSEVKLTTGEFRLLTWFVTHPNRVWDQSHLVAQLVADGMPTTNTTLVGRIKNIRKAMKDSSQTPRFIGTIRGSGYKFLAKVTKLSV